MIVKDSSHGLLISKPMLFFSNTRFPIIGNGLGRKGLGFWKWVASDDSGWQGKDLSHHITSMTSYVRTELEKSICVLIHEAPIHVSMSYLGWLDILPSLINPPHSKTGAMAKIPSPSLLRPWQPCTIITHAQKCFPSLPLEDHVLWNAASSLVMDFPQATHTLLSVTNCTISNPAGLA